MRTRSSRYLWLPLIGASSVLAEFTNFQFAGNGGNKSAVLTCGTGVGSLPYGCIPPAMCSRDTLTQKWYCCNPGDPDAVCWTGASKCEGTGTGEPSGQQLGCVGGTTKYCCLNKNEQYVGERCTGVVGQFNICWSNFDNALRPLNKTRLNETFSSLSSASPSATAYTVARAQLNTMTSTTPGASPASSATSARSSATSSGPSASSSAPAANNDDGGLSGGAIGGIVGGVVGGLALVGAIGFFVWRRRRSGAKTNPYAQASDPYQGYSYQPQAPYQGQAYSPQPNIAQPHSPPADKYAQMQQPRIHEAPAFARPVEMDANYYQQAHGYEPPKPGQQ